MSRGSDGNVDNGTAAIASRCSEIKHFTISETMQKMVDHAKKCTVLGWGLRNSIEIVEHHLIGGLVSCRESAYQLGQFGYTNQHLVLRGKQHGILSDSKNPFLAANYSYPDAG